MCCLHRLTSRFAALRLLLDCPGQGGQHVCAVLYRMLWPVPEPAPACQSKRRACDGGISGPRLRGFHSRCHQGVQGSFLTSHDAAKVITAEASAKDTGQSDHAVSGLL